MALIIPGSTSTAVKSIQLTTPGQPTGTPVATGGTLAAGTNFAKIVAVDNNGNTTAAGTESASVTTVLNGSIVWSWTAVPGAVSYQIWVSTTTNTEANYYTSTTNTFTQTAVAASGTSGTIPAINTTGSVVFGGLMYESSANALTAAGTNQATALQLGSEINRFTTVGAGTGCLLPPAQPGLTINVVNRGANPLKVYGNGSDAIDGVSAATGVTQMVNSYVIYSCSVAGQWESEGLATGFGGPGLQTMSYADGLSANIGATQGTGTAITTTTARFTTVGGAGYSATLMTAAPGLMITVINAGANAMAVFPATGDAIAPNAANASVTIPIGVVAEFYTTVAGTWHMLTSAPVGTTTNDNAPAGFVGEYVTSSVVSTTVNLTTGTTANITTISLTPGDWDVTGGVLFQTAATTTVTACIAGISTTTGTLGADGTYARSTFATVTPGAVEWADFLTPVVRISIATTTTVYLVGQSTFATSTQTAGGYIRARRVR